MSQRPVLHQGMTHAMPHGMAQGVSPTAQQNIPQGMPQGPPHGIHGMSQNGQVGTHLPHYGNPSTLPPKPPTGV